MIDQGRIVFQEEKDVLLDNCRIVKGDTKLLTEEMRKLFLSVTETPFGFTGITKYAAKVQDFLSDVIIERSAIEDIMLANMENVNLKFLSEFSQMIVCGSLITLSLVILIV